MAATTAGGTGTATTTQTTGAAPTATAGPALGFTSSHEEVVLDDLEVTGALPAWLAGSLLRTGPARFEVGERTVGHWFDGLGQLHRFSFAEGRVAYASRFLRSRAFTAAERDGRLGLPRVRDGPLPLGLPPRRLALHRRPRHDRQRRRERRRAGRALARPDRDADAGRVRPAHAGDARRRPSGRPATTPPPTPTTTAASCGGTPCASGARSSYLVYAQRPGERRVVAKLPVRRPAYHHSFALTDARRAGRGALQREAAAARARRPAVRRELRVAPAGRRAPARVDRRTGARAGTWAADPFFCFHHVNAFEDGDDLVVDLLAFDDARDRRGALPRAGCATASRPAAPAAPLPPAPGRGARRGRASWPRGASSCP